MATNEYDYTVNYDDERFQKVDEQAAQRETELDKTYAGMIGGAENIYQPQIDALDKWEEEQTRLQNERTDLTIQQIEQQKAQAQKDYQKEQSGAYVDWRKQSNQYGTEAEKMASSGLMGTGYSESSQVSMYNTYQNRIAQARESFEQVKMNYNNAINEAKMQNNSILAEIAANTLKEQTALIVQGTIYKNSLITDLMDKKIQLQQLRDNNWQKVLDQINTENAMAQDDRQFYEKLDFDSAQAELDRNFQAKQADIERQFKEQQEALNRQHDFKLLEAKTEAERKLAEEEHKREMAKLAKQQEYALAQAKQELANQKSLLQYQYDLENTNSKGANMTFTKSGNPSVSQIKKDARNSTKTNKTSKPTFTGSTYKEAVNFLKGIGWNRASGIMTMGEWSRRKNAGSTAAEVKNYKTYEAYLKAYCQYAVAQTYG